MQDLDKFREEVYKAIGTLEILNDEKTENLIRALNGGCLGFLFGKLFIKFALWANKTEREKMKIDELKEKADELLAKNKIKELVCANLDAKVTLPLDAAYKLTPVLYDLAKKDEKSIPLNAVLFAIVCEKIVEKGVNNYCALE